MCVNKFTELNKNILVTLKSNKHFSMKVIKMNSDHQIDITPLKTFTTDVSLVWNHLSYTVDQTSGYLSRFKKSAKPISTRNVIVKNQSGSVKSGELIAIIGPSGAGKTTLLEFLAGRRHHGVKGSVYVTDNSGDETTLTLLAQENYLLGRLTVRETLTYAAKFKSCSSNVDDLVDSVLKQLNMTKCASRFATKCSGGERKRLSIGIELIAKPKILMLDEPTSGLDSQSALFCVQFLERLTTENHLAIIASIHQPSASLLSIFHKVLILSNQGQLLYFDKVKKLHGHLTSIGLTCPPLHNIADYAIEIASGVHGEESINKLVEWQHSSPDDTCLHSKQTNGIASAKEESDPLIDEQRVNVTKVVQRMNRMTEAFLAHHTWILTVRTFYVTLREPWLNFLRFFAHILLAIVVSYLYNSNNVEEADGCLNTLKNITNLQDFETLVNHIQYEQGRIVDNISFFLFSIVFLAFTSISVMVMVFPSEVTVFAKEHKNGCYSVGAYYLAKSIADAPFTLLNSLLYTVITYYCTGQIQDASRFVVIIFTFVATSFIGQSIGMLIGALFAWKPDQGAFVAPVSQLPFVLLSGFFIKATSMPKAFQILSYLSYMRYAFELVLQTTYGLNRCSSHIIFDEAVNECVVLGRLGNIVRGAKIDVSTIIAFLSLKVYDKPEYFDQLPELENDLVKLNERYANVTFNSTMNSMHSKVSFYQNSFVMNLFSITDDTLYVNVIILVLFFLGIRVATYFALRDKAAQKK